MEAVVDALAGPGEHRQDSVRCGIFGAVEPGGCRFWIFGGPVIGSGCTGRRDPSRVIRFAHRPTNSCLLENVVIPTTGPSLSDDAAI
jgi:hypothetical protein